MSFGFRHTRKDPLRNQNCHFSRTDPFTFTFTFTDPFTKIVEIPPFDALFEQASPFTGFGQVLSNRPHVQEIFRNTIIDSQRRLQDGFQMRFALPTEIPNELDRIVSSMWKNGWNPRSGNINLFTCDFGCVLGKAILDSLGGRPIFRSAEDLSHFSIFWDDAKVEAFPFHKVVKCLHNREGESMTSFRNGIASKLRETQS
jgi:hypothetical protein